MSKNPYNISLAQLVNIASGLMEKQDYRQAVPLLRKAIELAPNLAEVHLNLSSALLQLGEFTDEAEAAARASIRIKPELKGAYDNLLTLLNKKGSMEALGIARKVVELNPNDAGAYKNLSIILLRYNQFTNETETAARKIIDLQPNKAESYYFLIQISMHHKRLDQAKKLTETALKFDPNSTVLHSTLSTILINLSKYPGAQKEAEEATKLNPNSVEAHYNLGLASLELGNYQQAAEHAKKATELSPNAKTYGLLVQALTALGDMQAVHQVSTSFAEKYCTAHREQPATELAGATTTSEASDSEQ